MKVFISYAREDIEAAKKVYASLKREKLEPWLDVESLLPGQNWKETIVQAIKESSFFLALLSSNSVTKRGFVQRELKIALDVLDELPPSNIYLIPIRLDDCRAAYPKLQEIQWVDLFPSYDDAISKILQVLLPGRGSKNLPPEAISFLSFGHKGEQIIVHYANGNVEIWDAYKVNRIAEVAEKVSTLAISPSCDKIIYCTEDRIKVLALEAKEVLTTLKIKNEVTSLAYSYSTNKIVLGYGDGTLGLWDIWGRTSGSFAGGFVGDRYGKLEGANKVAFSPDDSHIISLSTYGNRIKVWNTKSFQLTQEVCGYDRIEDFALSPDGKCLVWIDVEDDMNYNSTMKICGFPVISELKSFYDSYLLQTLDFSPNGKYVAAATNDRKGVIRIYDIDSNKKWFPYSDAAVKRLVSNEAEIFAVAFSPDGKKIASGDSNGMLTIWDVE